MKLLVTIMLASTAWACAAEPVVSNLSATQRAFTRLVDITYDVSAVTPTVNISLRVSSDSGATYGVLATSLTGDVGSGVTVGTGKTITWNAGADWPEQLSETVRFQVTADDGEGTPEGMSLISGGNFTMGRTSGDTFSDAPPVSVTVDSFYMGKHEVSKALWDEVRTWGLANGYTDLPVGAGKAANHPVQMVSWLDALKWTNARSEKEGLTPVYSIGAAIMKTGTTLPTVNWTANGYRLPTEAEWEKAARGGLSGKRFPSGLDTISQTQANYYASPTRAYDLSAAVNNYHPTYATGGFAYTSPVASFAPNAYGLHDMAGNVWEWCWDLYGTSTYTNGSNNPKGASSGANRVNRGGGWSYYADGCSAAFRSYDSPSLRHNAVGIRVVRKVVP